MAAAAVAACHAAGIAVKMITGDHVATATAIAGQVGLLDGHERDQVHHLDLPTNIGEVWPSWRRSCSAPRCRSCRLKSCGST